MTWSPLGSTECIYNIDVNYQHIPWITSVNKFRVFVIIDYISVHPFYLVWDEFEITYWRKYGCCLWNNKLINNTIALPSMWSIYISIQSYVSSSNSNIIIYHLGSVSSFSGIFFLIFSTSTVAIIACLVSIFIQVLLRLVNNLL